MKPGDLVIWTHEFTGEKYILYVLGMQSDGKVKCLFPYGAYHYADPERLEIFEKYKNNP